MLESSSSRKFLSNLITGLGNFSVQYNFQSISTVLLMISASECTLSDDSRCRHGDQAGWIHGTSTAVIFIGAIIGQLVMGYVGDVMGRSKALILTVTLSVFSSLFSATIPSGSPSEIYSIIIAFRLFLGIGLGGVYPLSAAKSSEDSGINSTDLVNPIAASWTFFWQIPGMIAPNIVALLILSNPNLSVSTQWRLLLGLGSIPLFLSLLCLLFEQYDSKSYSGPVTTSSDSSISHSASSINMADVEESELLQEETTRYAMYMIASGGTWLLYDIVAYGVSLSGGEIIDSIANTDDNVSSSHNIVDISQKQLIATSMGIPGTVLAIYLLPYFGLKSLQIYSFIFIAIMSLVLACAFDPYKRNEQYLSLFIIYCVLNFSIQCGCNITSFALPSALYPRQVRSTYNGIASAFGKVGAVIGSYSFFYIAEASSYGVVMGISCAVCLVGALVSYLCIDNVKIENSVAYHGLSEENDFINTVSNEHINGTNSINEVTNLLSSF